MSVAAELCAALKPACDRLIVAGSLRRRKPTIGDIEILYISKVELRPDPADLFSSIRFTLVDDVIAELESAGVLERRLNSKGQLTFGPKNKLMRHRGTGLPVDLFAATTRNWFNYLVCRTGPAESNIRIAQAAQLRGWNWNPYGSGFSRAGDIREMTSEAEVFAFVGLPFFEPKDRR